MDIPFCKYRSRKINWNHSCGSKLYLERYAKAHCYNCDKNWKISESQFKREHNIITQSVESKSNIRKSILRKIIGALTTVNNSDTKDISKLTNNKYEDFIDSVFDNLD